MADESPSSSGQRFSEDLQQIREERGVSISEVHNETQIPETLIKSFEEGRLYDHPTYNRVYLRSFVRAYADALDISREAALAALDAALDGTYDDALTDRYLSSTPELDSPFLDESPSQDEGPPPEAEREDDTEATEEEPEAEDPSPTDPPVPASETRSPPTAGGPEGRGGIVGPPRAVGEEGPVDEPQDSLVPDVPPEDGPESSAGGDDQSPPASPDLSGARDREDTNEAGDVEEEDPRVERPDQTASSAPESSGDPPSWTGEDTRKDLRSSDPQSEPSLPDSAESEPVGGLGETGIVGEPTELGSGSQASEPSAVSPGPTGPSRSRSSTSGWMSALSGPKRQLYLLGAGIVVVFLVLLGLGIAYFSGDEEPSEPEPTVTAGGVGSATSAPPDTASRTASPPPADVTLGPSINLTVLATGNVSALRVQRDEDLRRPYWIEEDSAGVFPFEEEVTLENQLSDVRLFLEGYPYPFQPQDTVGGLQITRSEAEAFVDTLRGAPPSLSVSPDTIPVGTLPE